jgi:hypothetical protein
MNDAARPPATTPVQQPGRVRQALLMTALVAALLLSVLAAATPGSTAAVTASVRNSNDTAATAPYFTCAAAYTASSPSTYYKLDDTTGTTAVNSGTNARDGLYQGTVTKGAVGACTRDSGTAVTLDGSSGYVSYSTSAVAGSTYTTEAWLKTTTGRGGLITGFGAAASGGSLTVDHVLYLTNTGRVVFGVNNLAKAIITSPAAVNDGTWHHLMATAGTTGLQLYVDGAAVAGSTTTATSYSGFFRVGYDNLTGWTSAPTSNFLAGSLDEVALYGRTLTPTDALNHYSAGRR